MAEHYCPVCGITHGEAEAAVTEDAIVTSAEVEIAKIQADRDIQLAKIQAKIAGSELIIENAALEATAEATADANDTLADVIAPPDAGGGAPPVVVVGSPEGEPEGEPDAPPEVETPGGSDAPKSRGGYGNPMFFN